MPDTAPAGVLEPTAGLIVDRDVFRQLIDVARGRVVGVPPGLVIAKSEVMLRSHTGVEWWGSVCACGIATPDSMRCDSCDSIKATRPLYIPGEEA